MRASPLFGLALLLAACGPAAAQDAPGSSPGQAVGFRLEGLDLAVFEPLTAAPVPSPAAPRRPPLLRAALLGADAEAERVAALDTLREDAAARHPSPWRIAAVAGGSAGAALLVIDHQRRRWWADRSPTFRVSNDWEYVRWADKLGHFYSAAVLTRGYRGSLRWAGVSEPQARLWGAVGGFTSMLYFETLDGFGPQWGFSPGDLVFNTLGVFVATAQADDPRLDAVRLKLSYWPSGWEGKNPIDDYAGQTYWLTLNPHRLAPEAARAVLPPWLNLAVGYGARDRDARDYLTTSLVYVGLDLEPAGLPIRGKVWEALLPILRHVHFPFPAVRLTPAPAFLPFAF